MDGRSLRVKKLEFALNKAIAKLRKDTFGKGALDVQTRVMSESLNIRIKTCYSVLEKQLLQKMFETDREGVGNLLETYKLPFERLLAAILAGEPLSVKRINVEQDFDNDCAYAFVLLDRNLEKEYKDDRLTLKEANEPTS